jgi:hypothetical protein
MPDDLRKYSVQTRTRLIIWFVILLFTVGLGLIWVFYGRQAALLGLLCLLGTAIPIGLIALFLFGLDKIVKKNNQQ